MVRTEQSAGRSAGEALVWGRSLVDPALRAAVDTLPASMRHIAAYHFGWRDEHGRPVETAAGGKAIRPTLVLLAAEAAGGDPAAAVPAAVAVELVHNFSLLHDDVMDGDTTRRHRPAAWCVFGTGEAILAGDAMLTLALDLVGRAGHPTAADQLRMLGEAVFRLVDGQHADLSFERRGTVGFAECLDMAAGKTGALLAGACALGALCAGGRPEQVDGLRAFGEHLGLAFQFVDDLHGIWGDPAMTGRPVHTDLRTRKKSLPVVAALTSADSGEHELHDLYHRERPLSETELARAAELIDLAGGRAQCRAHVHDLVAHALRRLRGARPAAPARTELETIARRITGPP